MKAQIEDAEAVCIECREGITNPICPECLAKEMESWDDRLAPILFKPEFDKNHKEGVKCLFCGRPMAICAHCYSRDIYESLLDSKPELAEEFMDTFNYGLREEIL